MPAAEGLILLFCWALSSSALAQDGPSNPFEDEAEAEPEEAEAETEEAAAEPEPEEPADETEAPAEPEEAAEPEEVAEPEETEEEDDEPEQVAEPEEPEEPEEAEDEPPRVASTADSTACERPSVPGDVDRALNKAETAFSDLDIPTFLEHSDEARQQLVCLNVLLPTGIVARMHRVEGLRAFGERSVFAVRAFAAARSLDFAYTFPPELVPPGSPILEDWDAMDLAAGGLEPLPTPTSGKMWIDGVQTLERPTTWPSVVQLLEDDGTPVFTAYLRHEDAPPDYPVKGRPVAAASETVEPPRERSPLKPRVPLLIGAGTTAVATGVMAVVAGTSRATYFDEGTPQEDLADLRSRTNSMAIASTVTGLATVGLGVGVALTW